MKGEKKHFSLLIFQNKNIFSLFLIIFLASHPTLFRNAIPISLEIKIWISNEKF